MDVVVMKLLISRDADGKITSNKKTTTLITTASIDWTDNFSINTPNSFVTTTRYLIKEIKININTQNTSNYTAIMGAAWRGDNDLVQYLADKGAKLNFKTRLGWSVSDMANGPSLRSSV